MGSNRDLAEHFLTNRFALDQENRAVYRTSGFSSGGESTMRVVGWHLVFVCAAVSGCLGPWPGSLILPKPPVAHGGSIGIQGMDGRDVIALNIGIIEVSPGDPYINEELWKVVDESGHDLERKATLEENSLRAGTLGGQIPSEFQKLLVSSKSCVFHRLIQTRFGSPVRKSIGADYAQCNLDLIRDGRLTTREYLQSEIFLEVTAEDTPDKKIKLKVIPTIRHGELEMEPRTVTHPSGFKHWEIIPKHNEETLGWLNFDLELAQGEFAIIGCLMGHPESLGERAFLNRSKTYPMQRLLVLRAVRQKPDDNAFVEEGDGPLPIASQAVSTIAARATDAKQPPKP